MRIGNFWQMLPGPIMELARVWERMSLLKFRFHKRDENTVRHLLWRAAVPVAWISETGRRVDAIAERSLSCRWAVT